MSLLGRGVDGAGVSASIGGALVPFPEATTNAGPHPFGTNCVMLVRRGTAIDDPATVSTPLSKNVKAQTPFGRFKTGDAQIYNLVPDTIEPQIFIPPVGRKAATLPGTPPQPVSSNWVEIFANLNIPLIERVPLSVCSVRLPSRLSVRGPKQLPAGNVVPAYTPNGLELQATVPYNVAGDSPEIVPCAVGSKAIFFFRNNGAAAVTAYILPPMDRTNYLAFANKTYGENYVQRLLCCPVALPANGNWYATAPSPGVFDVALRAYNPANADPVYGHGVLRFDSAATVDVDVFRVDLP